MEEKEVQEAFPFLFNKFQEREKIKERESMSLFAKEFQNEERIEAIKRSSLDSTSKSGTKEGGSRRQSSASRKHEDSSSPKYKTKVNNEMKGATFSSSLLQAQKSQESNAANTESEDKTLENAYVQEGDDQEPQDKQQPDTARSNILEREEFQFIKDIQQKKFGDLKGHFYVHGKSVFYSQTSLYCLQATSEFRWGLVWLVEWKWFDRFIMLCIMANAVVLALFDFSDRDSNNQYNQTLNYISDGFTVIFLVESWLKIAAMGFVFHKYAYLRDTWNLIDFIIVLSGVVDFLRFNLRLKGLRVLRVVRPLRSVKAIPSMRRLVSTLLRSLPELGSAGIFIAFMLFLFTILGLQQFSGIIYNKCRVTQEPIRNGTYWPKSTIYQRVCSSDNLGGYTCPSGLTCGSAREFNIPLINDGVYDDPTIQYSIGSFENFGEALLGVFQAVTGEGWVYLMYNIADGYTPIFVRLYFCIIVIMGHYYMLQFLLAVIIQNLAKIQADEAVQDIKEKRDAVMRDRLQLSQEIRMSIEQATPQIQYVRAEEEEKKDAAPNQIRVLESGGSNGKAFSTDTQWNFRSQENFPIIHTEEKLDQFDKKLSAPDSNIQNRKQSDNLRLIGDLKTEPDFQLSKPVLAIPSLNKNVVKPLLLPPVMVTLEENNTQIKESVSLNSQKKILTEDQIRRQRELDEVIKENFMWNLGKQSKGQTDLSKGIGLAVLARVVGVEEIEAEIQPFHDKMKVTKEIKSYPERMLAQRQIQLEIGRMCRKLELEVTKKYEMSRKSIYGVDNELHLVEQIQRSLDMISEYADEDQDLKTSIIRAIDKLVKQKKKSIKNSIDYDSNSSPELTQQMHLVLKLSMNLKEISQNQNVKEFFFARFKRQLYKKNLADMLQIKIDQQILETDLNIRSQNNFLVLVCFKIQDSIIFRTLSILFIFGNAITLALSSHPENIDREKIVDFLNLIFSGFFLMELLVKIVGQGFSYYFRDTYNWFDSTIVMFSVADITLEYTVKYTSTGSGAITALRVFRLIKLFKLAKFWKEFQQLLSALTSTIKDVSNISILMLILVFTYMLLGLELFAYRAKFNKEGKLDMGPQGKYNMINFNSPFEGFISVFIVLSNEGWIKIYQDNYRASDSWTTSIFFYSLVTIGQFILLNLFIAILIENFEELSVRNDLVNKLRLANQSSHIQRIIDFILRTNDSENQIPSISDDLANDAYQDHKKKLDYGRQRLSSLNLFAYDGRFRQFVMNFVAHRYFEYLMVVIILLSTLQLAADNPISNPDSALLITLAIIDKILTVIFSLEMIMKIIAFGVLNCGSTSYLRSNWNILDMVIVIISYVSFAMPDTNLNLIKVIRLMKILRPLRAISRNQGLMLSIKALTVAISSIFNVIIVITLFLFILGIIGVNYFKGRFYDCSEIRRFSNLHIHTKWDCKNSGGDWTRLFLNFDDILNAMQTLFITSTAVNWSEILQVAAATQGQDVVPADSIQSPLAAVFFIIVVVIGNFFLLNLFVGVIITTYNREKELVGKDFMLTDMQKKWLKNRKMIVSAEPKFRMKLPNQDWRQPFFYTAESSIFQYFILLCILSNTVVLTLQWQGMSKDTTKTLDVMNFVFSSVFIAEFCIKLVGYGERYFKDSWNVFDMIIVVFTIIGIIIQQSSDFELGPQTTIIRSFRIARVFYLFKRNKALKGTFITFLLSLPALVNIGSLILLIVFIYSVLAVYLFATVKLNGELDAHANFQDVGSSFLMMIRITTGESWPKIMEALSRKNSATFSCTENPTYMDYVNNNYQTVGCGDQFVATVFFFSYVVLIVLIFMRLFIAIILQTFSEISEKDSKFVNSALSDYFRDVWCKFDPDATGFIKAQFYNKFLVALGEPLGWDVTYEHNYMKQQEYFSLITLPKYNRNSEYSFMDVFEQLILIMIIRREVVNFAIKSRMLNLLDTKMDEIKNLQQMNTVIIQKAQLAIKKQQQDMQNQMMENSKEVNKNGEIEIMRRNNILMAKMIQGKAAQLSSPAKVTTIVSQDNKRAQDLSRSNIDIVINQSVDNQRKSFTSNKYRTESQLNSRQHSLKQVYEENSREGGGSSSRMKAQTPNIVIHPQILSAREIITLRQETPDELIIQRALQDIERDFQSQTNPDNQTQIKEEEVQQLHMDIQESTLPYNNSIEIADNIPIISLPIPEIPKRTPQAIQNDELMMVEEELSKIEPNHTRLSFDSGEIRFEEEKMGFQQINMEPPQQLRAAIDSNSLETIEYIMEEQKSIEQDASVLQQPPKVRTSQKQAIEVVEDYNPNNENEGSEYYSEEEEEEEPTESKKDR